MTNEYKRGEIYLAELDGGIGSEQAGRRPVIIIQNDIGNKCSPTVIVAALTSETKGRLGVPTHYHVGATNGLDKDSVILFEQIRTIDKSRIIHYIGQTKPKQLRDIDQVLSATLGLNSYVPVCLCPECARILHSSGAFFIKREGHADKNSVCVLCRENKTFIYNMSLNINRRSHERIKD